MRSPKTLALTAPALDLHEADILGDLPALRGWVPEPVSPFAREVLGELTAIAWWREAGV